MIKKLLFFSTDNCEKGEFKMGFIKRLLGLEAPSEQEIQESLLDNALGSGRSHSGKCNIGSYYTIDCSSSSDSQKDKEMDASVRRALINAGVDLTIISEKEKTKEYYDKIQEATLQRQTEERMRKEEEVSELQALIESSKNAVDALVNGKF